MKSPGRLCAVLLGFFLGGCASWSQHGVVLRPPEKLRIAVLPVQIAVQIKRLKSLQTLPPGALRPAVEEKLVQQKMREVTEAMTRDLERKVGSSYFFEVVPSSDVERAMSDLGLDFSSGTWTTDATKALGERLGARALLRARLSGYGSIKRKWVFFLIGSGVVEGSVQGAVVLGITKNPWLAAGLAAEEILQEALTWGGGAYLFGRVFTPVVLEGELLSVRDGSALWRHTAFARINSRGLKKFPKEERRKKEVRLLATADEAENDLVESLERKVFRNRPQKE